MQQLRRGAGDRSARVLILIHRRCQGREKFVVHSPIFRRYSLTKQVPEQVINKKHVSMRVLCSRAPCGGIIPPPTHPLCEGVTPSRSHAIYKIAPSVAGVAATLGALSLKHERASSSTVSLFRRRSNENSERDVA